MTDKSDDKVRLLNTILAIGGGNLNDPIFKSSNARGLPGGGPQCSPEAPAAGVFADYSPPKRRLLLLHKTTENYTCVDLDSFRRGKKGANDNLA